MDTIEDIRRIARLCAIAAVTAVLAASMVIVIGGDGEAETAPRAPFLYSPVADTHPAESR